MDGVAAGGALGAVAGAFADTGGEVGAVCLVVVLGVLGEHPARTTIATTTIVGTQTPLFFSLAHHCGKIRLNTLSILLHFAESIKSRSQNFPNLHHKVFSFGRCA